MEQDEIINVVDSDTEDATAVNEDEEDIFQSSFAHFTAPAKRPRLEENKEEMPSEAEDGEVCPICYETFTSSGEHRLCCLKCGHIFGYGCIEKWLRTQTQKSTCPQCNAPAKKKHIRLVYCKSLMVMDTSERDRAISELAIERRVRKKLELETAELRLKFEMAMEESRRLRDTNDVLERKVVNMRLGLMEESLPGPTTQPETTCRFELLKSVPVSETGKCRVMVPIEYLDTLCVSQPSSNPLFKGFGIRKIDISCQRGTKYVPLHSDAIRCLTINSQLQNGLLASGSVDKTLKLTSLLTDQAVQTYSCSAPVWSCAFSSTNQNHLFAGLSNGSVLQFDLRHTSDPVNTLGLENNRAPVVGLATIPANQNSAFRVGGVFVGQLNKLTFWQELPSPPDHNFRPHCLPLLGSLASLSLDPSSGHLLSSLRPSLVHPTSLHIVDLLITDPAAVGMPTTLQATKLRSFTGGKSFKNLSRSLLFQHPEAGLTVAAGIEEASTVQLWSVPTQHPIQTLSSQDLGHKDPVLDICAVDHGKLLTFLTEKQVSFYRYQ